MRWLRDTLRRKTASTHATSWHLPSLAFFSPCIINHVRSPHPLGSEASLKWMFGLTAAGKKGEIGRSKKKRSNSPWVALLLRSKEAEEVVVVALCSNALPLWRYILKVIQRTEDRVRGGRGVYVPCGYTWRVWALDSARKLLLPCQV